LTSSLTTIENYRNKLKTAGKWMTGLISVCVLFLILKAAAIILRIKFRIKLPWIIDVLV
jgi:hypothetical protein